MGWPAIRPLPQDGGEGGTSYVLRTPEVKIRLRRVAIPEPVLKYFSRSRAVVASFTAMYASNSHGRRNLVDSHRPWRCSSNRRLSSFVEPTYSFPSFLLEDIDVPHRYGLPSGAFGVGWRRGWDLLR